MRKCTLTHNPELSNSPYIWLCECGKPESDHIFISEKTDLACEVTLRCDDGELTSYTS